MMGAWRLRAVWCTSSGCGRDLVDALVAPVRLANLLMCSCARCSAPDRQQRAPSASALRTAGSIQYKRVTTHEHPLQWPFRPSAFLARIPHTLYAYCISSQVCITHLSAAGPPCTPACVGKPRRRAPLCRPLKTVRGDGIQHDYSPVCLRGAGACTLGQRRQDVWRRSVLLSMQCRLLIDLVLVSIQCHP